MDEFPFLETHGTQHRKVREFSIPTDLGKGLDLEANRAATAELPLRSCAAVRRSVAAQLGIPRSTMLARKSEDPCVG